MEIKNRQKTLVILAALGVAFLLGDKMVVTPLMARVQVQLLRPLRTPSRV